MKPFIWGILLMHGVSGFDADIMFVEGDSVTLHTDVKTNQRDRIRWYFNSTRIAQITGDLSKICTDVQCNEGNERFRGRLKLNHQTGSLTIMNIRTTDSGLYHQEAIISGNISEKIFSVIGRPGSEAVQMKRNMKGASDIFDNAIKNPTLSKGTGDSRIIAGVILSLLAIPAIVLIYWKIRNSKRNEPKRKNREESRETCDVKFRDGLMSDEKIGSSEMIDYRPSIVKCEET
ncbi:uncharacterized protein LOC131531187 [Onychostoma macrolepis]|uniref:uncharacterized protein LOC131531187 n=1 Tax=Onychostoma macrolepis TaxID=369639 RepID=UPI00272B648A|nr:uncharacterized protein LOC131531187 [Onychostoma macrolepis]XP_058617755.1 uncharacterized protein LOC131531187 [Onychostoma macrolepis]XP_058617756.1 uncharacterized protein LOC131531187 [Onychostoma macrolepis]